uniref:P/Homo B domain-containing protein n=1 Tax=Rhabditophanes sp. KR3021 TaxID=114890 RepID=A0AC35TMB1_9BILA
MPDVNSIFAKKSLDVKSYRIEKLLKRFKRTNFDDPLYNKNWYIHNTDLESMEIEEAWEMGYTGKGITVTVVDDGLDFNHKDLKENYSPESSYNFNENKLDPTPRDDGNNLHGTQCAGIIAMKPNNELCGVGVAYDSRIGGIKLLDGFINDKTESDAFGYMQNITDIYCNSYGPEDFGTVYERPNVLSQASLEKGAREGRQGKGNIYIFASGNGGRIEEEKGDDSCGMDGYAQNVYSFAIAAIDSNYEVPVYAEQCGAVLVSTYSNRQYIGNKGPAVTTEPFDDKCSKSFAGTSLSAPIFAGIVALVLESNSNLTWRDIKHIVVRTSEMKHIIEASDEGDWTRNKAGLYHSPYFGFGLAKAKKMIETALKWVNVETMKICTANYPSIEKPLIIWANEIGVIETNFTGCHGKSFEVNFIETVQLSITGSSQYRGNLTIDLISPSGTQSQLMFGRKFDNNTLINNWKLNTLAFWGESAKGTWKLLLHSAGCQSMISNFFFTVYGTKENVYQNNILLTTNNAYSYKTRQLK